MVKVTGIVLDRTPSYKYPRISISFAGEAQTLRLVKHLGGWRVRGLSKVGTYYIDDGKLLKKITPELELFEALFNYDKLDYVEIELE